MNQETQQNSIEESVKLLAQRLTFKNLKLVTVESCTGGWIAQELTSIAGSSNWFERGFVTYSNEAKHDLVGVSLDSLDTYGAVSFQVAREMAIGGLHASLADVAVSVTGIAGPDGGSPEKPLGTVWIGWADNSGNDVTELFQFSGNRHQVRMASVKEAIAGIINFIE